MFIKMEKVNTSAGLWSMKNFKALALSLVIILMVDWLMTNLPDMVRSVRGLF